MPRYTKPRTARARIRELEARLAQAEETLRAIRSGEVDALMTVTHLTEQKQSESMAAADQIDSLILEQATEAIIVCDVQGRIIRANPAAERLARATLLRQPFDQIFNLQIKSGPVANGTQTPTRDDRPWSLASYMSQAFQWVQATWTRDDQKRFDLLLSAGPLRDAHQGIIGAVVTLADITAFNCALVAPRESAERFRRLAANAPDIIYRYRFEPTPVLEYVSPAVTALTGYTPAELYADPALGSSLIGPEDRERFKEIASATESAATPMILRARRRNGEEFWTEHRFTSVRDDSGNFMAVEGIARDITVLKRVELEREQFLAQLETERNRWRATIESMLDLVAICDAQGRVTYLNAANARMMQRQVMPGLDLEAHPSYYGMYKPDGTIFTAKEMPLQRAALYGEESVNVQVVQHAANGEEHILLVNAAPLRAADGTITGAVTIGHDVTEQRRMEQALRESQLLLRAVVEGTPDPVYVKDRSSRILMANPALAKVAGKPIEEIVGKTDGEYFGDPDVGRALREHDLSVMSSGQNWVVEETVPTPEGQRVFLSSKVPYRNAAGNIIGVIGISRDITERKQAEEEVSRLLVREQHARAEAEQNADRIARLQAVTAALSGATTPAQVIETMVEQSMAAFRAQAGLVALRDELGEHIQIVHARGYPPSALETWPSFAIDDPVSVARAIRTGEPVWIESEPERRVRFPEHSAVPPGTVPASVALPLVVGGRTAGALALDFVQPRVLEASDRSYMLALSQQGAQALERARLYDAQLQARREAETARRRVEFLSEASRILSVSLDHDTTLQDVADLAVRALADLSSVDLLNEDGTPRAFAIATRNPALRARALAWRERFPLEMSASDMVQALQNGVPVVTRMVTDELVQASIHDPEELAFIRELGVGSVMIVPLSARGHTLGVLTLVSTESGRYYGEDDLALARELGHRAALALDNARLYQEAQNAIRLRDQFFTVASHELKTPLTSMTGYAEMLYRDMALEGSRDERAQRAIKTILDQTRRLNRMVTQLLDVSRMERGQLYVERAPVDLVELARRMMQDLEPALKHHRFDFQSPDAALFVDGDELRLEQVLQNLLQNAIKYSPRGGTIGVRVEARDGQAVAAVSDQGIGIPASALPNLFTRFYRAHNVQVLHIPGMGMGLFVVKEIVALHGGTVEVESREGEGSTFTITLPLK